MTTPISWTARDADGLLIDITAEREQSQTVEGELFLPNLPTSDPGVEGQVWNDAGTLKVSAG